MYFPFVNMYSHSEISIKSILKVNEYRELPFDYILLRIPLIFKDNF